MTVHIRAQYLTSDGVQMRGVDYDATMLVSAVKGKTLPANQYVGVQIGGKHRTIREANKDDAVTWFAEWAAPIVSAAGQGIKVLVPVPNRSAVAGHTTIPRTTFLAAEIQKMVGASAIVADVLRWRRELPKSTDAASRKPEILLPDLVLTGAIPQGHVVLVDDVFTSGGHIVASAWRLVDAGRTVSCAVACGRTLHYQADQPFQLPPEDLVIPPRPS